MNEAERQHVQDLLRAAENAEKVLAHTRKALEEQMAGNASLPETSLITPEAAPVAPAVVDEPARMPVMVTPAAVVAAPTTGVTVSKPATLPLVEPAPVPAPKKSGVLGGSALAWTGGAIFLLGIFFFLALAIQRGWLSETARCLLGAGVSGLLVGGAFHLRSQSEKMQATLACAGVGIAGLYGSLLAASGLYSLIGVTQSLALALIISAIAVAVSLALNSQALALLALLGSLLGPPLLGVEVTTSTVVVIFAVTVFGTVLAAMKNWKWLLVAIPILAWTQIPDWIDDVSVYEPITGEQHALSVIILSFGFGLILYAGAFARQYLHIKHRTGWTTGYVVAMTTLWWMLLIGEFIGGSQQLGIPSEGLGLVAIAGVLFLTPLVYRLWDTPNRNLTTLMWSSGITVSFFAILRFTFDDGPWLISAVAILSAALMLASTYLKEERLVIPALGFIALTALMCLALVSPSDLFEVQRWHSEAFVFALVTACAATFYTSKNKIISQGALWAVGFLFMATGAVAIMSLTGYRGEDPVMFDPNIQPKEYFELGQMLMTAFFGVCGLASLYWGLQRKSRGPVRVTGLVILAGVVIKLFFYDLATLEPATRAGAFLFMGALLVVAGFYYQKLMEKINNEDDEALPAQLTES